jgi:hypothetical protein
VAEVTYCVALPFVASDDGVAAGEPTECFNPNAAVTLNREERTTETFAAQPMDATARTVEFHLRAARNSPVKLNAGAAGLILELQTKKTARKRLFCGNLPCLGRLAILMLPPGGSGRRSNNRI